METADNSRTIEEVVQALLQGDMDQASSTLRNRYPFVSTSPASRRYTEIQATRIFKRDGFIDRYSGQRLVFPPVLRLLSQVLPADFPYHSKWKMTECHVAYWELSPTLDHIVPIARGGKDEESNLVCTSMLQNSAKANWLLEELGWCLRPKGDLRQWDGLLKLFLDYTERHQELLQVSYFKRWHRTASLVLQEDDP